MKNLLFTLSLPVLLTFSLSSASAEVNPKGFDAPDLQVQCAELLEECFAYTENERANCFYSASQHPFCEGTELGKMTYKRWALSPVKLPGHEAPPAFLGPQLVNASCLANFDNQWFSKIVDRDISDEVVRKLGKTLESCRDSKPVELPRP